MTDRDEETRRKAQELRRQETLPDARTGAPRHKPQPPPMRYEIRGGWRWEVVKPEAVKK